MSQDPKKKSKTCAAVERLILDSSNINDSPVSAGSTGAVGSYKHDEGKPMK